MSSSKSKKRQQAGQSESTSDDDSRTSSFTKSPKRSRSNSVKTMTDPEPMANSNSEDEDGNPGPFDKASEVEHGLSDLSTSSSSEEEEEDNGKGGSRPTSSGRQSNGSRLASSSGKKSPGQKKHKQRKHRRKIKRVQNAREETPESDPDLSSDLDISSGDDGADLIINLNNDTPASSARQPPTPSVQATGSLTQSANPTQPATANVASSSVKASSQYKKPSGAIAVSVGLKLGAGRAVGGGLKIGRPSKAPLLFDKVPTTEVEVIDYSAADNGPPPSASVDSKLQKEERKEPANFAPIEDDSLMSVDHSGAAGIHQSGNESEASMPFSMDSNEFTALADSAVSGKSSALEDDADDSSGDTDSDSSMASVDSFTWRRQRLYQYRQVTPELLQEGSVARFRGDESVEDAKARLAADIPGLTKLVEKHHICDVCAGKHQTASCEHLKCEHCGKFGDHFSFNCPTRQDKNLACPTCLESNGFSMNDKQHKPCSHMWRTTPNLDDEKRKMKKIPVFCYYCGQEGHFGDNCTVNRAKTGKSLSIWNRDAAKEWTTMKFPGDLEINPFKKFGASKDSPIQIASSDNDEEDGEIDEDEDDGWFASRSKVVKEKIPDSKFTGMKAELPIAPRRGDSYRGGGGGRGGPPRRSNRPPSPDRYGGPSRRRSRSPPYRGRGGGGGGRGGYRSRESDHDQRDPVRFGMGRGRGQQPPLPPGPPPPGLPQNMRTSRDHYLPGGMAAKRAWNQYKR